VTSIGANAHWRTAAFSLAILLFGMALGTILMIPVLYLGGIIIRIPGVHAFLDSILTADFDAPLMWALLVSAWLLGIVITYMIVAAARKSRDADHESD
jgi:hypothetical protein